MSQGSRTDLIQLVHGDSGYRRGCRCNVCRDGRRAARKRATKNPPSAPWNSVPVDRFWPILEDWMQRNKQPRFFGDDCGGVIAVSRLMGCDAEAIRRIQKREWITFQKADRILCAIGRVDAWHTELEDIYSRERPGAEQAA